MFHMCSFPFIKSCAYHLFNGREISPSQGTLAYFSQILPIHSTCFPMMHHLHSFPWAWWYYILRQLAWILRVLMQIIYTHFHGLLLLTLGTSRPDRGDPLVPRLHPEDIRGKDYNSQDAHPPRPCTPPPARKRVLQRRRGNMAPGGGRQRLQPL